MTATALRNRLATLLLVAGVLVLFRGLWTDGSERAEALYVVVLGLGYGHLLGAALVGRRASGLRPQGVSLGLWRLFSVTSIGTLFLAYFALLELFPATSFLVVASPLLAISVWHTVENDTAVADAYGRGFRMRSIERQTQGRTMAITCLVALAAALASADEVIFAEVFAISTLYHLFQWLVFLSDRIVAGGDRARGAALLRGIAWTHLPAAFVCAVLVIWRSSLPPLAFELAFSPSLYLFWSSLHVLQTGLARRSTPGVQPLSGTA